MWLRETKFFLYQPEEIGTSEKGARGSRIGITPLQKATSGNQEAEMRFLALRKALYTSSQLVQAKTGKARLNSGELYGSKVDMHLVIFLAAFGP